MVSRELSSAAQLSSASFFPSSARSAQGKVLASSAQLFFSKFATLNTTSHVYFNERCSKSSSDKNILPLTVNTVFNYSTFNQFV